MSLSPVVKKDLLIGGGLLVGAVVVARFVHHTPQGTVIASPSGISPYGAFGNLASPSTVNATLGNYPTTTPTGTTTPTTTEPTAPITHWPNDPHGPATEPTGPITHWPNDPHGPTSPPGITPTLPGVQPVADSSGCRMLPDGSLLCPQPPSTLPGVR